jgi:hypothetical protein
MAHAHGRHITLPVFYAHSLQVPHPLSYTAFSFASLSGHFWPSLANRDPYSWQAYYHGAHARLQAVAYTAPSQHAFEFEDKREVGVPKKIQTVTYPWSEQQRSTLSPQQHTRFLHLQGQRLLGDLQQVRGPLHPQLNHHTRSTQSELAELNTLHTMASAEAVRFMGAFSSWAATNAQELNNLSVALAEAHKTLAPRVVVLQRNLFYYTTVQDVPSLPQGCSTRLSTPMASTTQACVGAVQVRSHLYTHRV